MKAYIDDLDQLYREPLADNNQRSPRPLSWEHRLDRRRWDVREPVEKRAELAVGVGDRDVHRACRVGRGGGRDSSGAGYVHSGGGHAAEGDGGSGHEVCAVYFHRRSARGGAAGWCYATYALQQAFMVNSTGDGGDSNTGDGVCNDGTGICTLRAAIEQANAHPGNDTIAFNVPGCLPSCTISLTSALPFIDAIHHDAD